VRGTRVLRWIKGPTQIKKRREMMLGRPLIAELYHGTRGVLIAYKCVSEIISDMVVVPSNATWTACLPHIAHRLSCADGANCMIVLD